MIDNYVIDNLNCVWGNCGIANGTDNKQTSSKTEIYFD